MFRFIPRQKSYLSGKEILTSFFLSFTNKFSSEDTIILFCNKLKKYLRVKNISLLPSARYALINSLKYYKIKEGDEIILPAHTYPGYLNIINSLKLKPKFAKIGEDLNINVNNLLKLVNNKTKIILIVHHYGKPVNIKDLLTKIREDIIVIEDCTQAFGAEVDGKKVGTFGNIGLYSFSRGKYFDLMGGACLVSKDVGLIDYLNNIKLKYNKFAFIKNIIINFYVWVSSSTFIAIITTYPFMLAISKFTKRDIISTYLNKMFENTKAKKNSIVRFNGVQAWLGLRRLKRIDKIIENQIHNANFFNKNFKKINSITLPKNLSKSSIYLYYPILVNNRDDIAIKLLNNGIDTKRDFNEVLCKNKAKHYIYENMVSNSILHIPVYPTLTEGELKYIVFNVKKVLY